MQWDAHSLPTIQSTRQQPCSLRRESILRPVSISHSSHGSPARELLCSIDPLLDHLRHGNTPSPIRNREQADYCWSSRRRPSARQSGGQHSKRRPPPSGHQCRRRREPLLLAAGVHGLLLPHAELRVRDSHRPVPGGCCCRRIRRLHLRRSRRALPLPADVRAGTRWFERQVVVWTLTTLPFPLATPLTAHPPESCFAPLIIFDMATHQVQSEFASKPATAGHDAGAPLLGDPEANIPNDAQHHQADTTNAGSGGFSSWLPVLLGFFFLTLNSATAIVQSRGDAAAVAFVCFTYADLVALFLCLRMYERAPAGSSTRSWLKVAVRILTTLLTLAFSGKVAAVMPPPVSVVVWLMGFATVAAGFVAFFVCNEKKGGPEEQSWKETTCLGAC